MALISGMRPALPALFFVLVLLGLSACTTVPPPAASALPVARDKLQAFSLIGRFSLRQEGQSYTGRLDWRHADDSDELLLSSPLGQGMAEIRSNAAGARLTDSDGKVRYATSAEALLRSVLGYPLPLDKLADWVRGRNPAGGQITLDPFRRPARLQYEDWRIAYEYDSDDPQALPGRLFVERETVLELRLRIDEWAPLTPPEPVNSGHPDHSAR